MVQGAGAAARADGISPADRMTEELVHRRLPPALRAVFVALTLGALAIVLNQQFNLRLFDVTLVENRYLFVLAGVTLPLVFLAYPWNGKPAESLPVIDILLALVTMGAIAWFAWQAERILGEGWNSRRR